MILIQLISIIAGFLGLIVSLITFKNHKSNQIMNIYFVLFMGILSLRLLSIGISAVIFEKIAIDNYYIHSCLTLLAIPNIYLYFKKLATGSTLFDGKEFIRNFSIPIVLFLFVSFQMYFNIELLNNHSIIFQFSIPFLYSLFYIYLSFKILSEKIWSRKVSEISKKQNVLINYWTKFLFIILVLSPIKLLVTLYILLFEKDNAHDFNNQPIGSLVIIIICVKILIKPEILYGYNLLTIKIKENRTSNLILDTVWNLSTKTSPKGKQEIYLKQTIDLNLLLYIEKIEKMAFENDLLMVSEVTLGAIASKLAIPKSHLVYLFKYHSKVSFIDFKKIIRIHYATIVLVR